MTRAQGRMYDNYRHATATELYHVYGTFSKAKADAFDYCRKLQQKLDGTGGRICSANSFQFTYAFEYKDEAGDICLCYITKEHDYMFPIV